MDRPSGFRVALVAGVAVLLIASLLYSLLVVQQILLWVVVVGGAALGYLLVRAILALERLAREAGRIADAAERRAAE